MPKPNADLCMRVDLPLDKKTVENQDWTGLGHRAAGPPGRGPLGLQAAGPLGRRGPLGRGPAFSKTPQHWIFCYCDAIINTFADNKMGIFFLQFFKKY